LVKINHSLELVKGTGISKEKIERFINLIETVHMPQKMIFSQDSRS